MKIKHKQFATEVASRAATLLDVPLIFDLMMDGSESGAFTEQFMTGSGTFRLLMTILVGVFRYRWGPAARDQMAWTMLVAKDQTIGFMNTRCGMVDGVATAVLVHLAFKPECRDMGFGGAVVKAFVAAQPDGAIVKVYCTKYARAMQHLLKTLRFKRLTVGTPSPFALETYLLAVDRAAETRSAQPVAPQHENRAKGARTGTNEELSVAR